MNKSWLPLVAVSVATLVATHIYFFSAAQVFLSPQKSAFKVEIPREFNTNETWTAECQRFMQDDTWAEMNAPFADKVDVKEIVKDLDDTVKIIPTVAALTQEDVENFTLEKMLELPDNIIIKPAHKSGGVAKYFNGTYHCFKRCKDETEVSTPEEVFEVMKTNMEYDVNRGFHVGHEKQYEYIEKRIIIEEHLPMDGMVEMHWWIVKGTAVFASITCDTDEGGHEITYLTTGFDTLNMRLSRQPCTDPPPKPTKWEEMKQIAERLGSAYDGIIRVDLFANDVGVWFGELTLTSGACKRYYEPIAADALLYNVLYDRIRPEDVTPELVERYINGESTA